jgi:RNA polymerase-binding transcription factor DksA
MIGMRAKQIVNELLEADEANPKKLTARVVANEVRDIAKKPVPAKIVSDETGETVEFDARKGLAGLLHRSPEAIQRLIKNEFQGCEEADRVADWGGDAVNNVQSKGPYEVYISFDEADSFLEAISSLRQIRKA